MNAPPQSCVCKCMDFSVIKVYSVVCVRLGGIYLFFLIFIYFDIVSKLFVFLFTFNASKINVF